MKNQLIITAAFVLSFFYHCSLPYHGQRLLIDRIDEKQLPVFQRTVPFRGSGKIEYAIGGKRLEARFDVRLSRDRILSATFYSPLGTIVGCIIAGKDSGTINIQGQEYTILSEQYLDTFFSPSGMKLTLRDLTTLFSGKIMSSINISDRHPDTVRTCMNGKAYIWKSFENEISIIFSRYSGRLKRIKVRYFSQRGGNYSIQYDSFSGGFVRIITIKVDDRNYFSIKYERIIEEMQGS